MLTVDGAWIERADISCYQMCISQTNTPSPSETNQASRDICGSWCALLQILVARSEVESELAIYHVFKAFFPQQWHGRELGRKTTILTKGHQAPNPPATRARSKAVLTRDIGLLMCSHTTLMRSCGETLWCSVVEQSVFKPPAFSCFISVTLTPYFWHGDLYQRGTRSRGHNYNIGTLHPPTVLKELTLSHSPAIASTEALLRHIDGLVLREQLMWVTQVHYRSVVYLWISGILLFRTASVS